MFIPVEAPVQNGLRPLTSNISENDWSVLAKYWYPVAIEGDVKDTPLKGKLLDVDLVVYKVEGKVAVAVDVCPHRHIRLSAGTIENDRLVCPFHGLAFNAAGQCTKVPALGRDAKLPAAYRLQSVRAEAKYGLIWACLDAASTEQIPNLWRIDEVGIDRLFFNKPRDWPVTAPYQVENYLDIAHLPWVHDKSLGGDRQGAVPIPVIKNTNEGLQIDADFEHIVPDGAAVITYHQTVHMPFSVYTDATSSLGDKVVGGNIGAYQMFDLVAPISAHECRVFFVSIVEPAYSSRESKNVFDGSYDIAQEDIDVLQHLARPDYPLEEKRQLHLPVDNISNAYRERLRDLGLGRKA